MTHHAFADFADDDPSAPWMLDGQLGGMTPPSRRRSWEAEQERQPVKEDAPPPLTIEEWLARDLPEPDFLMGRWLTTTTRALLVAPTGLGKTNLSMAMAMAIAAGADFLHWKGCGRPCRVLYIDGEMAARLLKQRIADTAMRLGCQPETFFALSHEDIKGWAPLNTQQGQALIEREIERIGNMDLIVFDSIMCLLAGDMKDGEAWSQFMPWVRSLTTRKIGQLCLHHTGHDESRSYGDKTREWQLDSVLHLTAVPRDDTDVSFSLEFRKARERTPATRQDFQTVRIALVDDQWQTEASLGAVPGRVSPLGLKFLSALENAISGSSAKWRNRPAAAIADWRAECERLALLDRDKPKHGQTTIFGKYRRELIAANRIACGEDLAWVL